MTWPGVSASLVVYLLAADDNDPELNGLELADALLAFGSAAFGAAIALISGFVAAWWRANNRVRQLLTTLRIEFDTIIATANERAGRDINSDEPHLADPLLPTSAWQIAIASGELARLSNQDVADLVSFYQLVDAANAITTLAPTLFLYSQVTDEAVAKKMYARQANRSTVEKAQAVIEAGRPVGDTLGRWRAVTESRLWNLIGRAPKRG